jgi:thiaminase
MLRTTTLSTRHPHRPWSKFWSCKQMLQTMQQTLANMQQNQQAPQLQQRDKLGEFQRTKPPTFSHSVEPMDAYD